jgi:hypothetical protein
MKRGENNCFLITATFGLSIGSRKHQENILFTSVSKSNWTENNSRRFVNKIPNSGVIQASNPNELNTRL